MFVTFGMLGAARGPQGAAGGYPVIAETIFNTDNAAPYQAQMPAVVNAGDLLLIFGVEDISSGTPTSSPVGWNTLVLDSDFCTFYRFANGTEGGTLVTVPISSTPTYMFTVVRITGADPAQPPELTLGSLSSATLTPNPPAVTPSWADTQNLFMCFLGSLNLATVSAYPTGYDFYRQENDGTGATSVVCAKESNSSAIEDPSNFTLTTIETLRIQTLAIKGLAGAPSNPLSVVEVVFNEDPATPWLAAMPAVVTANDLLIIIAHRDAGTGGPSGTPPTGWTALTSPAECMVYYKWAAGTEGGTNVTVNGTGGATIFSTVFRIKGADPAQNPEASALGALTGTAPNPPPVDPSWADYSNLFIAFVTTDDAIDVTAYPTGYILSQYSNVAVSGSSGIASKLSSSSASENPSAFTLASSADTYAGTIAVKGL